VIHKSDASFFVMNLRRLYLSGHQNALPAGFLAGDPATPVANIYDDQDQHTPLSTGFLVGPPNLRYLDLENHTHALPEGLLDRVQNLQILDLRGYTGVLLQGFADNLWAHVYNGLSIRA